MDLENATKLLRTAEAEDYFAMDCWSEKFRAAGVIVLAYFAEHPADDCEPVTEDWLGSVGAIKHKALWQWSIQIPNSGRLVYWPGFSQGEWWIEGPDRAMASIPALKTRGHVRRLLSALGVDITPV